MFFLVIFNFLGLIAFMLSGALFAIKHKMDLVGVISLSAITGLGGGTIRDILLQQPIFWMQNSEYLYLAIGLGFIAFLLHDFLQNIKKAYFEKVLNTFDILGLSSFMITSTSLAQRHHQSFLSSVILSVITCVGGGVIRDIICNKVPFVFKSELYATSVAISSGLFIVLGHFNTNLAIIIACLCLISIRIISIQYDLHLPRKYLIK